MNSAEHRAGLRARWISLPQPQGARCPETLPRAWAANSRGPPSEARGPQAENSSREIEGRVGSRTERRAVLLGPPRGAPQPGELGSRADRRVGVAQREAAAGGENWGAPACSASPRGSFSRPLPWESQSWAPGTSRRCCRARLGAAAQVPAPEAGPLSPTPGLQGRLRRAAGPGCACDEPQPAASPTRGRAPRVAPSRARRRAARPAPPWPRRLGRRWPASHSE